MGVGVGVGGSHRLALCQGPRSCRATKIQLEIEKPRVKTLSYDFPK